jgi:hypothetical protein
VGPRRPFRLGGRLGDGLKVEEGVGIGVGAVVPVCVVDVGVVDVGVVDVCVVNVCVAGVGLEAVGRVDGGLVERIVAARAVPVLHEDLREGLFAGGLDVLGARGEVAVVGVGDELLGVVEVLFGCGFGLFEVEAGDLEAVEEQAGAAGVEVVGGDAAEDLADGVLDGGTVLGVGEVEGGAAVAGRGAGGRAAGGVVVVAELLVAKRG